MVGINREFFYEFVLIYVHLFLRHPWESVTLAALSQFPNAQQPYVSEVCLLFLFQLLKFHTSNQQVYGNLLFLRRLSMCHFNVGWFFEKIIGGKCSGVSVEDVLIDRSKKEMKTCGRNYTFSSLCTIENQMNFRPVLGNPSKTTVHQVVEIKGSSLLGPLKSLVENACLQRYLLNASVVC